MIRRTTWIALLVFLVVLAGFVWVQRSNQDQEPEITPTTATQKLFDIEEQALTRISVQSSEGKNLELVRPVQGEWSLTQPQIAPADSVAVQSALSQFLSSEIVSSPGSLPGLEALNLENALYKILLVSQDGSQDVINIGKETATGSGYYVLASNQSQVVVVNKAGLDALLNLLENPPLLPTPAAEMEMPEGVEQTQVP